MAWSVRFVPNEVTSVTVSCNGVHALDWNSSEGDVTKAVPAQWATLPHVHFVADGSPNGRNVSLKILGTAWKDIIWTLIMARIGILSTSTPFMVWPLKEVPLSGWLNYAHSRVNRGHLSGPRRIQHHRLLHGAGARAQEFIQWPAGLEFIQPSECRDHALTHLIPGNVTFDDLQVDATLRLPFESTGSTEVQQ